MTKYNYKSLLDRKLIDDAYSRLSILIFGEKRVNLDNLYRDYFNENVKEVNVFKQGTITTHLNSNIPGICRYDENGKLIIDMLGTVDSKKEQKEWLTHESTHEYCHSFANLLPQFLENNRGIIKNNQRLSNHAGMIRIQNASTLELEGQKYYGKMFNETMMDIISTMAIKQEKEENVSDVLIHDFTKWRGSKTGYSVWTSITRLMIAAFSNDGSTDYDKLASEKKGLFDIDTTMRNSETKKANDFMYGILFDPLHIQKEFDKFTGEGNYKAFCELIDQAFLTDQLNPEFIKGIMNILADFVNAKCNNYIKNGLLNQEDVNKIIDNFNRIWNSLQTEYQAYFSQEEINEITNRGRYL